MLKLRSSLTQLEKRGCVALAPRNMATQAGNREGDISSVFVSLSGGSAAPLPPRFADIKRQLIAGNEMRLRESWNSLLSALAVETATVARLGSDIIPQIDFRDIAQPPSDFLEGVKKRGVGVIRQVVPRDEARIYKTQVEEYVMANPWTKGKCNL